MYWILLEGADVSEGLAELNAHRPVFRTKIVSDQRFAAASLTSTVKTKNATFDHI